MDENSSRVGGFWTPPPRWKAPPGTVPLMPRSEHKARCSLYHVHKVPPGDSPYGVAKMVQLVEKDLSRAVSLFWAAINSGDRVDSALKDMAVVMKQLNRSDEAIEAIKSFRHLCPIESQESLDNVLLELYKRSGRLHEEIQMLQVKLKHIEEGISFRGKRTKVGRSQGKKVQITIEKEYCRLLGNLAWAYLQQKDYRSAEEHYRKALSLEPDKNKQCNLAICLMHLNKMIEAKFLLQTVSASCNGQIDESFSRSFERATQMLGEFESDHSLKPNDKKEGMCGEIQNPFSSFTRRNSGVFSETANENHISRSEMLKLSPHVHQDEMLHLAKWNRASSCVQNFHESDINLCGSKRRNIECNRLSNGQKEEGSMCIKKYDTSFSLAKTPCAYTQPQKCLRLRNKGNRGGWYDEESSGVCSRKLLFQQATNFENVQFVPCHNIDKYKETKSARSLTGEDCRKNLRGDPANMSGQSFVISISSGVLKRNFLEIDEQRKVTKDEFNLGSKTSVGGHITRMKEFSDCDEDSGENSASPIVDNMGLKQEAENGIQIRQSKRQLKTNVEQLQDLSVSKNRTTWADMVEEDEQELLNGTKDLLAHEQGFPFQKSVFPHKNTPNEYFDDGKAGEQFVDENRNSNIIPETPCSLNQHEGLSQKIESLVLRDGYYTQPRHAGSSINQVAKRPFCFDQYQNLEREGNCFMSPLQKRSLNFERDNSASLEEDHAP